MIISFKHKFIYIKSHKVAGSSIEKKLKDEALADLDVYTAILPEEKSRKIESDNLKLNKLERLKLVLNYLLHFKLKRAVYWLRNSKITSHDGILEAQVLCNRFGFEVKDFFLVRNIRDKKEQNYSRYKMYKRRGITNDNYESFLKKFGTINESWQFLNFDKSFFDINFSDLNQGFEEGFLFLDLNDYTLDNLKK